MIFIFYERFMPNNIDALSRLKKRLPENHPKYMDVCTDLYNFKAGHGGEERVDEVLRKIAFPTPYAILPNIRLLDEHIVSTQIDILIMTTQYVMVLEVKNWTGTLNFRDSPSQLIQETPTMTRSLDCPCVQAETTKDRLSHWLQKMSINLPVYHAVVFPYASTILNVPSTKTGIYVASELPLVFKKLNLLSPQIPDEIFSHIVLIISNKNTPFKLNPICADYSIHLSELKKGLYCSHCNFLLTRKSIRIYYCPNCLFVPPNPFVDAMADWFSLVDSKISNKQLKEFTNTTASYTIGYYMRYSGYVRRGTTKGSVYYNESVHDLVD